MRIFLFCITLLLISHVTHAQWQPINTSSTDVGNIYHINGNVGIGTNNPKSKLDVNGLFQLTPAGNTGTSGALKLRFIPGTSATIIEANSDLAWANHDVIINAANSNGGNNNQFTVYRNGNVGVGTNAPETKFHVKGGAGRIEHSTEASIQYKATSENQWWDVGTNVYGYYVYEVSSQSYKFVVSKNGNVGVGVQFPDAKLAVKGDIHCHEVRVDLLGAIAPDYVFEKGYPLRTLEETEAFINRHKHLPEIPSAKELSDEGLNLKEMNLKLLQKVEELTLYVIQQNKDLAEQKKVNEEQSKLIQGLYLKLK